MGKDELLAKITGEIDDAKKMFSRCNTALTVAASIGFLASVAATILAAGKWADGGLLAAITALPAAMTGADPTFKLSKRVSWHMERRILLEELHGRISTGAVNAEKGVEVFAEIRKNLEKKWG